jgi:hypothetical protein
MLFTVACDFHYSQSKQFLTAQAAAPAQWQAF